MRGQGTEVLICGRRAQKEPLIGVPPFSTEEILRSPNLRVLPQPRIFYEYSTSLPTAERPRAKNGRACKTRKRKSSDGGNLGNGKNLHKSRRLALFSFRSLFLASSLSLFPTDRSACPCPVKVRPQIRIIQAPRRNGTGRGSTTTSSGATIVSQLSSMTAPAKETKERLTRGIGWKEPPTCEETFDGLFRRGFT